MTRYRVNVSVEVEAPNSNAAYDKVCETLYGPWSGLGADLDATVSRYVEEVEPEPVVTVTPAGVAYLVEEHALTPEDQMRVFDVIMRGPGEDFPVPEFMTDPVNPQE
jgi:hypothetical protein